MRHCDIPVSWDLSLEVFADEKSRVCRTLRKMVGFTVEMKASLRVSCSGLSSGGDPKRESCFLVKSWRVLFCFVLRFDADFFFFFNMILLGKGPSHHKFKIPVRKEWQ